MTTDQLKIVRFHLAEYVRTGSKMNRKRQFRRLLAILDDIFEHEPECRGKLNAIGKKQVIGYWRRNTDSDATRMEKWHILKLFFSKIGKPEPPKPRPIATPQNVQLGSVKKEALQGTPNPTLGHRITDSHEWPKIVI